jgi:hypothetical protein
MNKEEFANLIKALRNTRILPPNMKPEPSRKKSVSDNLRIIGTLTTRSIKPGRTPKARTYDSFGTTETHRVTVIELKPEDRATLQSMAKRCLFPIGPLCFGSQNFITIHNRS